MAVYYSITHTIEHFRQRPPEHLLRLTEVRVPIDVEGLAQLIGIHVNRVEGMKWDGVIFRKRPIINVLKGRSLERQRFTIAHGIGHLLLHDGDEYREDFLTDTEEERQANRYAVELLLPPGLVAAESRASIGEQAKRFGVSWSAMKFRLDELGFDYPMSAIERVAEEEFLG